MPRYVYVPREGPVAIPPQARKIWICGCGLTRDFPFCDGSHAQTRSEVPERPPVYDVDGRPIGHMNPPSPGASR